MAEKYIPTWEELQARNIVWTRNGVQVISINQVNRLIAYLHYKGKTVDYPEELKQKRFWEEADYQHLCTKEPLIFTFVITESRDFIDPNIFKCMTRVPGEDD